MFHQGGLLSYPGLSVDQPHKMVQFLKDVFGAKGEYKENRPSELRIGDSLILVGGTLGRMPTMSFLYVYVEDVDEAYDKALSLGAISIEEPREHASNLFRILAMALAFFPVGI
jgi:PhnB protein